MHECPECGQACYCSGDIDDASVMSSAWVYENCECCDEDDMEEEDDDYDSGFDAFCQEQSEL